jgi:hypothetical protein
MSWLSCRDTTFYPIAHVIVIAVIAVITVIIIIVTIIVIIIIIIIIMSMVINLGSARSCFTNAVIILIAIVIEYVVIEYFVIWGIKDMLQRPLTSQVAAMFDQGWNHSPMECCFEAPLQPQLAAMSSQGSKYRFMKLGLTLSSVQSPLPSQAMAMVDQGSNYIGLERLPV